MLSCVSGGPIFFFSWVSVYGVASSGIFIFWRSRWKCIVIQSSLQGIQNLENILERHELIHEITIPRSEQAMPRGTALRPG
jgi:hypothetical protein